MARIEVIPPKPYDYYVDPIQFGAKGDGTTDDYVALNAAIAYASAQGGGVVRLRNNTTYAIGTTLSLSAYVCLEGGGDGSRIKALSDIGTIIKCYAASVTYFDIWLKNFSFYVANNISTTYGLVIDGAVEVNVENVRAATPGGPSGSSGILDVAFYFRNTFRNRIRGLDTTNHKVTTACYYLGDLLNANHFDTLYTSNSETLFSALVNDVAASLNSHANLCDNFVLQGSKYGLRMEASGGSYTFNNLYTENVVIPISMGAGGATTTVNCAITSGSATVTASSGTGLAYGQRVTGTGIPVNTFVANRAGTTITLTNNATATNGTASLTFTSSQVNATTFNGGYLTGWTSNIYSALATSQIELLNVSGAVFNGLRFQPTDSSHKVTLTITPASAGSGAVAYGRIAQDGTIKDVVVTDPGSGYTTGATVAAGGPGSGATFTATKGTINDVNGSAIITDGIVSIAVTGAGSGWTPSPCPIAILYDTCGKALFQGCYYDNGSPAGRQAPLWSGIGKTATASASAAIDIIGDRSGIDSSSGRFSKTTGSGYTFLAECYTNTGLMLARIITVPTWLGS